MAKRGRPQIPDDALRADVAAIVESLERPPTTAEYNDLGEYSALTVRKRFGEGSWVDALNALGYDYEQPTRGCSISADALRADVERVAGIVGQPPTVTEYGEHGEYAYATISRRLGEGSWISALQSLGYQPVWSAKAVSDSDLQADVERVAARVERPPIAREYREHGTYALSMVARRFGDGTWLDALETLGYSRATLQEPGRERIPTPALREDLERVTNELGQPPSTNEYWQQGAYSTSTLMQRFIPDGENRSWQGMLDALGYSTTHLRDENAPALSDADLKADFEWVVDIVGRTPRRVEYSEHGEYSDTTIVRRFGVSGWEAAVHALGYDPATPEVVDPIPEAALLSDVERIRRLVDGSPTLADYAEHGEHSMKSLVAYFQTKDAPSRWADLLELCSDDATSPPQS